MSEHRLRSKSSRSDHLFAESLPDSSSSRFSPQTLGSPSHRSVDYFAMGAVSQPAQEAALPPPRPPTRRSRPLAMVAILFLVAVSLWYAPSWALRRSDSTQQQNSDTTLFPPPVSSQVPPSAVPAESLKPEGDQGLVPLELHIVSKCPDTKYALRELVLPAMQLVSDKVDFKLSYIGDTTDNDGVECMHGPAECMGNILELCARELYPDPRISLGFVMCLSQEYKQIPDRALVEDCALEHAVDFQALNDCAAKDDGAHGMELLRNSVERTAKLGITTSCTIRLNNEVYCVRDSNEWTDCPNGGEVNDLVLAIEKSYRPASSAAPLS